MLVSKSDLNFLHLSGKFEYYFSGWNEEAVAFQLFKWEINTEEICEVCGWEDDNVQFSDPEYSGGANGMSLIDARKNFKIFGACSKEKMKIVRSPDEFEIPVESNKICFSTRKKFT